MENGRRKVDMDKRTPLFLTGLSMREAMEWSFSTLPLILMAPCRFDLSHIGFLGDFFLLVRGVWHKTIGQVLLLAGQSEQRNWGFNHHKKGSQE